MAAASPGRPGHAIRAVPGWGCATDPPAPGPGPAAARPTTFRHWPSSNSVTRTSPIHRETGRPRSTVHGAQRSRTRRPGARHHQDSCLRSPCAQDPRHPAEPQRPLGSLPDCCITAPASDQLAAAAHRSLDVDGAAGQGHARPPWWPSHRADVPASGVTAALPGHTRVGRVAPRPEEQHVDRDQHRVPAGLPRRRQ